MVILKYITIGIITILITVLSLAIITPSDYIVERVDVAERCRFSRVGAASDLFLNFSGAVDCYVDSSYTGSLPSGVTQVDFHGYADIGNLNFNKRQAYAL